MIDKKMWTVADLVGYIKKELSNDYLLSDVTVCGEIGNFTNHYSGHWYFSIKDNNAFINCAMFKSANSKINFIPKVSQQVIIRGSINVFEKNGQLQLIAYDIQPLGIGKFYLQFEQTKNKLEPLGYFSSAHKKNIPAYPVNIAVVTGANTAALQDIRITINKRWPIAQLNEFYALVQGDEAINDIIKALKKADESNSDVIILARGGGSVDDLWCFNDETLAKTIYNLKTPIVTGIGHEIDTTIADLVADLRCATPTAAATAVIPLSTEVQTALNNYKLLLRKSITSKIQYQQQTLDYYVNSLNSFCFKLEKILLMLKNIKNIMRKNVDNLINKNYLLCRQQGQLLSSNLRQQKQKVELYIKDNKQYKIQLYNKLKEKFNYEESHLQKQFILLETTNPLNIMRKGFSLTYDSQGKLIKSIAEIKVQEKIKIKYYDGSLTAQVLERDNDGKENII